MGDTSSLDESIWNRSDADDLRRREGNDPAWNHDAAACSATETAEAVGRNLDMIIPEHLRAAPRARLRSRHDRRCHEIGGPPTADPRGHKVRRKI